MSTHWQNDCGGDKVKIKLTDPRGYGSCETIESGPFLAGSVLNFGSGCNEFTITSATKVQVQTEGGCFCPKTVTIFSKDGGIFQSQMNQRVYYGQDKNHWIHNLQKIGHW